LHKNVRGEKKGAEIVVGEFGINNIKQINSTVCCGFADGIIERCGPREFLFESEQG
jgi:hypothetical protein